MGTRRAAEAFEPEDDDSFVTEPPPASDVHQEVTRIGDGARIAEELRRSMVISDEERDEDEATAVGVNAAAIAELCRSMSEEREPEAPPVSGERRSQTIRPPVFEPQADDFEVVREVTIDVESLRPRPFVIEPVFLPSAARASRTGAVVTLAGLAVLAVAVVVLLLRS